MLLMIPVGQLAIPPTIPVVRSADWVTTLSRRLVEVHRSAERQVIHFSRKGHTMRHDRSLNNRLMHRSPVR